MYIVYSLSKYNFLEGRFTAVYKSRLPEKKFRSSILAKGAVDIRLSGALKFKKK